MEVKTVISEPYDWSKPLATYNSYLRFQKGDIITNGEHEYVVDSAYFDIEESTNHVTVEAIKDIEAEKEKKYQDELNAYLKKLESVEVANTEEMKNTGWLGFLNKAK